MPSWQLAKNFPLCYPGLVECFRRKRGFCNNSGISQAHRTLEKLLFECQKIFLFQIYPKPNTISPKKTRYVPIVA